MGASPSMAVLLFAFGISLITGVAFGIVPAWISTRVDPVEALPGANRSTRQAGSLPRKTLVILQAVLSLGYKPAQLELLYRRIHDSLESIPGVSSVDACLYSRQNGDSWNDRVFVEGRPAPGPADDNGSSWDRVTAEYFETIGNPIVKGRPISERDTATPPHVAVINQA